MKIHRPSRLAESRATMAKVSPPGGTKVLVALSGGKDSLCTLDVCVGHFGAANVVAYHMALVEGLACEIGPIRAAVKRLNVRVIQVPHWELARHIKYGIFRPAIASEAAKRIRITRETDIQNYVRKITGITWIAAGLRAADSIVRNAYLKRIQGVDEKNKRFFPIWTWKKSDVYGYLHGRGISVPRIIGGGKAGGGVTLYASSLVWMRDNAPDDFQKVLKVFPFAEANIFRAEEKQREQAASK